MVSLIVWTLLTPTKQEKLAYPILKLLADPKDVLFVEVGLVGSSLDVSNLASSILEQSEAHGLDTTHLILHKISDFAKEDLSSHTTTNSISDLLSRQVQEARKMKSGIKIRFVNDLEALKVVSDRWLTNRALLDAEIMELGLHIPHTVQFNEDKQFSCPAIWKPNSACGLPGSHSMLFLAQPEAIAAMHGSDGILQQFIPHYGLLYKVYVIGEGVFLDLRPSLESALFNADSPEPQPFDSDFTNALPRPSQSSRDAAMDRVSRLMPVIRNASQRISQRLNLSLFGWDLIIGEDGKPYIIDLNYFPKFEGVSDFHSHLLQLLLSSRL